MTSPPPMAAQAGEAPAVFARTWNADTVKLSAQTYRAAFYQKQINYLSPTGFKPINPAFRRMAEGFVMDQAFFKVNVPLRSTGTAHFINTRRFDVRTKSRIHEENIAEAVRALGVADVPGHIEHGDLGFGPAQYVIYPNAYPRLRADLIYFVYEGRVTVLQKLIRFREAPKTDADLKFKITYSHPMEFTLFPGKLIAERPGKKKGLGLEFHIWDSTGDSLRTRRKIQPVDVTFKKLKGRTYLLTKKVRRDFFTSAPLPKFPVFTDSTLTAYPDASTGATTIDGIVNRFIGDPGETLAVIRAGAGTGNSATSLNMLVSLADDSMGVANKFDYLYRTLMFFDTSSLTSAATISAATLSIYGNSKNNGLGSTGLAYHIAQGNAASNNSFADSDYAQANFGTTSYGNVTYASFTAGAYNDISLNASGIANISKTGISKFSGQLSWDINNNFTGSSIGDFSDSTFQVRSADYAGTTYAPTLVVTYALTPSFNAMFMAGD